MAFATGKFSLAICDRCGMEYGYSELREEWTGLRTCPECWEEKHPQLLPPQTVRDPEGLENPRQARTEPMVAYAGGPGEFGLNRKPLTFKFSVGRVAVTIS